MEVLWFQKSHPWPEKCVWEIMRACLQKKMVEINPVKAWYTLNLLFLKPLI